MAESKTKEAPKTWAPEEAKVTLTSEGDGLGVLRHVLDTYAKHMVDIRNKAVKQNRDLTEAELRGIAFFQSSAECVQKLIEQ